MLEQHPCAERTSGTILLAEDDTDTSNAVADLHGSAMDGLEM